MQSLNPIEKASDYDTEEVFFVLYSIDFKLACILIKTNIFYRKKIQIYITVN